MFGKSEIDLVEKVRIVERLLADKSVFLRLRK
jgi:hypothetical protein